jgi:preprotein translocase subunit SecG
MLYNVFLIAQVLIALSIIGLVLIQHGKGADAGAAFGGGASGTVFGSRGSGNFLSRTTGILAALFFANSLFLAWMTAHPTDVATESVIPAAVSETGSTTPAPAASVPADVPQAAEPEAPAAAASVPADVPTATAPVEATATKPAAEQKEKTKPADVPD